MDYVSIVLTAISTLIKVAPQIVQTVNDLKPYATALYKQLTGTLPTPAEQATMEAGIDALFARLEQPLPAAQPGDPDYIKPTDPAA